MFSKPSRASKCIWSGQDIDVGIGVGVCIHIGISTNKKIAKIYGIYFQKHTS